MGGGGIPENGTVQQCGEGNLRGSGVPAAESCRNGVTDVNVSAVLCSRQGLILMKRGTQRND